jgi:hypothetical protein
MKEGVKNDLITNGFRVVENVHCPCGLRNVDPAPVQVRYWKISLCGL